LTDTPDDIELNLLLSAIRQRYGYDFHGYSRPSVTRRLQRAQSHFGCESLSILQHKVLHDPSTMPELLNFMTVQVSEMFRDPSYFRALREIVIPHLRTYPSLKVWVAGCSEGEELYSLAILFREEGLEERTIFYATDVNPDAVKRAKAGVYAMDRIPLFTRNHAEAGGKVSLAEYYTAAYGRAVFDKTLRARTVFAEHNLVSDQVFAEAQLVSCRNVLIYFDRDLQDRAIGLFKDALPRGGFLGLGSRESLRFSKYFSHFADFSPAERIYRRDVAHSHSEVSAHALA